MDIEEAMLMASAECKCLACEAICVLVTEIERLRAALKYALDHAVDGRSIYDGERMFEEDSCGCCSNTLSPDNPHIEVFRSMYSATTEE